MRIKHNIIAQKAQNNYKKNVGTLGKTLKKLSSGRCINFASDDAAGLSISEKLRAQITGLRTA